MKVLKLIPHLCIALSIALIASCFRTVLSDRKYEGLEYYIEDGYYDSEVELTAYFLYSPDFLTEYEYIDGDYQYLETGDNGCRKGGYEVAFIWVKYSPEVYAEAKQAIFDNTEFVSEEPDYAYNGYNFFRINIRLDWNYWFAMNAFNDEKNTIIMLSYNSSYYGTKLPTEQTEWGEFLHKYYGEYYDFDA